jgi:hypothetical protein
MRRKATVANEDTVNQDPMSPSFDLEAYLNALAEQKA